MNGGPGQRIRHYIVHTFNVANVMCEFGHVGQLAALFGRPRI